MLHSNADLAQAVVSSGRASFRQEQTVEKEDIFLFKFVSLFRRPHQSQFSVFALRNPLL